MVSAALKKDGTSRKAFLKILQEHSIIYSLETLLELSEVLSRPKFAKFISPEDSVSILELIVTNGSLVEVTSTVNICRDQNDNKFLNLAIDGEADLILTRDRDLLVLNQFNQISIVDPSQFMEL